MKETTFQVLRANGYSYLAKSGTTKVKVFIDLAGLVKVSKLGRSMKTEELKLEAYLNAFNDTKLKMLRQQSQLIQD